MDIQRIVYSSQPFGFDQAMLNGLLASARRNNERDNITGALVCRQDIYLQLLEGPQSKVIAAFKRIQNDDRHANIHLLIKDVVPHRLFGDWFMLHDPAQSWFWPKEEVCGGKIVRASSDQIEAGFTRLAEENKAVP